MLAEGFEPPKDKPSTLQADAVVRLAMPACLLYAIIIPGVGIVPAAGFEPAHPQRVAGFKSAASANSATLVRYDCLLLTFHNE